jgi:hypothetical protein
VVCRHGLSSKLTFAGPPFYCETVHEAAVGLALRHPLFLLAELPLTGRMRDDASIGKGASVGGRCRGEGRATVKSGLAWGGPRPRNFA